MLWLSCEQDGSGGRAVNRRGRDNGEGERQSGDRRAPREVCRGGPGRCGFQVRIKTTWTGQANILDAGCEQRQ